MLPNLRVIAASLLASIALITFGFGLFAAFRIANQSSVVFAHPNDVPARPVFAQGLEEAPAAPPDPTTNTQPAATISDNAPPAPEKAELPAPQAEISAAPASPEVSGLPPAVAERSPSIETPPEQPAPPAAAADAAPSAGKPADEPEAPAAPAVSAPAPEAVPATTPTIAAAPAPADGGVDDTAKPATVEAPAAPVASAPVAEALPTSTPTTAAAPAPTDAHADDTAKPATPEASVAAAVAPLNPVPPETTASIKHPGGAKKTIKPRNAPAAQQAKQKTKPARPARKPSVRRVVRRVAPRPQPTAQPGVQPAAQPAYSYSNWSTINNAQWARQPAWQTPAQPKARSTPVSQTKRQ